MAPLPSERSLAEIYYRDMEQENAALRDKLEAMDAELAHVKRVRDSFIEAVESMRIQRTKLGRLYSHALDRIETLRKGS